MYSAYSTNNHPLSSILINNNKEILQKKAGAKICLGRAFEEKLSFDKWNQQEMLVSLVYKYLAGQFHTFEVAIDKSKPGKLLVVASTCSTINTQPREKQSLMDIALKTGYRMHKTINLFDDPRATELKEALMERLKDGASSKLELTFTPKKITFWEKCFLPAAPIKNYTVCFN